MSDRRSSIVLRTGQVGPSGWTELAAVQGELPKPPRLAEVFAAVVHLSDLHVCDAESPARQEHLDRHGRPGAPFASVLGEVGTYRPQEILTVPVAIAMVQAVNHLERAPITGAALDAVVITGDLTDNAQANELDWCGTVLRGGPVAASSGSAERSGWVGAPDVAWSAAFWHPEGHRTGWRDVWAEQHGFPLVTDLLGAARSPFVSPGLQLPWLAVHGNHDALLQGTVPPGESLRALATGARRIVDLDACLSPLAVLEAVPRIGPARYLHTDASPSEAVIADPQRRLVSAEAFSRQLAPADRVAGPGHAYCSTINERVRLVALDTVNPFGGWEGSLDRAQLPWLREQLAAAADAPGGPQHVVVASHHPSWCLVNGYQPLDLPPRVLGDELVRTLLDSPVVVAWLSGHVHRHRITLHRRGDRVLPELTAASCIDWPQQARVLELGRALDGDLVVCSTALDHDAPTRAGDPLGGVLPLASLSRTLARNDPAHRDRLTLDERHGRPNRWAPFDRVIRLPLPGS